MIINNSVWGNDKMGTKMGLVFFEGGPLDQHAYETGVLLGEEALNLPILEYLWTSEKKTSEKTGLTAQVWRHKSIIGDSPMSTVSPAAVEALASQEYASTVAASPAPPVAPAPAPQPQQPAAAAMTGVAGPDDVTANVPTEQPIAAAAEATEAASTDGLTERRKALKLSVKQVSEATGLAASKIINIEKGTGTRVKDEEKQTLASYIAQCERGVPAGAHA